MSGICHKFVQTTDLLRCGFVLPSTAYCGKRREEHPEAAYVPKVGDRVRFTAEGVVEDADPSAVEVKFEGANFSNGISPRVGTWEKLPDLLPTTPGSVVRTVDGAPLALDTDGMWRQLGNTDRWRFSPDEIKAGWTLRHDEGATP